MLPYLIRTQFIDRDWGPADLDAAAEFWLRLYEAAARPLGFSVNPAHAFEVRIRGFARDQLTALEDELRRRVVSSDLPDPVVYSHDADTLVLSSGAIPGSVSQPAGLGLPLLAGPPFDGLLAEIRLDAVGTEGRRLRLWKVWTTLVLVGELRGGRLLLKAVWRSGSSGWEDNVCWHTPWPGESAWLDALDNFRATAEVPRRLARRLFLDGGTERADQAGRWLIHVPFGRPRLAGLVARSLVFVALFALLGTGVWWTVTTERWLGLAAVIAAGWWVFPYAWYVLRVETRLLLGYRAWRAAYADRYEKDVRYAVLDPTESAALSRDLAVQKYTADLQAEGFTFLGDVAATPATNAGPVYRNFLAPDAVTYLILICDRGRVDSPDARVNTWPAAVWFEAQTFFSGGGRVDTVGGPEPSCPWWPTCPETLRRPLQAADPVEFYHLHTAVAEAFAKERGLVPARPERFDEYVRLQERIHEVERQVFQERPYSWWDHLRWYLQIPRKAYRG